MGIYRTYDCIIAGRMAYRTYRVLKNEWWACRDSNSEHRDYESPALTVAPQAHNMFRALLVEVTGLEPVTSWLPAMRSPS